VTRFEQPQPYEEIDHTADAGVIVRGATREEALARLVLAFTDLVTAGGAARKSCERSFSVEPGDDAGVAVDLLRELFFVFESERLIPIAVEVVRFELDSGAEVRVDLATYDAVEHAEGLVLKAITLHEARFERTASGWEAAVVFDV
jgi:SHS2 domain-containing protein